MGRGLTTSMRRRQRVSKVSGGVFGMYAARLGTSLRCGSIAVYLYFVHVFTTRFMCDLNAYQVFTKVVKVYFEKYFTYEP